MIKYCIGYLGEKYQHYNAEKRVFVPAYKLLYVSTWSDLEQAREELQAVRAMFPALADNILLDSFVSYM